MLALYKRHGICKGCNVKTKIKCKDTKCFKRTGRDLIWTKDELYGETVKRRSCRDKSQWLCSVTLI